MQKARVSLIEDAAKFRKEYLLMKRIVILFLVSLMFASLALAGETDKGDNKPKNEKDKISYSLGFQIGRDFKKEKMDLDGDAFLAGVHDALGQKEAALEYKEMSTLLTDMKKKVMSRERAEKVEIVEKRLGGGKKFLEENAKKEGVITLKSGLQYRVINEGTGKKPNPTDKVKVHYTGKLIDGTEFSDSRRKGRPEVFHVNGVVRGITEALQLMKEGSRWEIVLPPEMGFSKRSELGYRTLIYDLELISIEPTGNENGSK